jgi:acetyl esterase/lipase
LGITLASSSLSAEAQKPKANEETPVLEKDGSVTLPSFRVPFSNIASEQLKKEYVWYIDRVRTSHLPFTRENTVATITQRRDLYNDLRIKPALERTLSRYAVTIKSYYIDGVSVDEITPEEGVSEKNAFRVIIQLHGGGFLVGGTESGILGSAPIASIGKVKVISINYRKAPEHKFPAASEDVSKVYSHLIKTYKPQNIGIFGCSAGATLTSQSISWFYANKLPRPGAISIQGAGIGSGENWYSLNGDADYTSFDNIGFRWEGLPIYHYMFGVSDKNVLANPVVSKDVLSWFPPTMFVSGTRDYGLSKVLRSNQLLIDSNVRTNLYIQEGAWHCSFIEGFPDTPEHQSLWSSLYKFFDENLGTD